MSEVRFTPIATRDISAIADYLLTGAQSSQGARKFAAQLDDLIENLKTFPLMGRRVDDDRLSDGKSRQAVFGAYWLFYSFDEREGLLVIQRVLHQRRNLTPQEYFDIDF